MRVNEFNRRRGHLGIMGGADARPVERAGLGQGRELGLPRHHRRRVSPAPGDLEKRRIGGISLRGGLIGVPRHLMLGGRHAGEHAGVRWKRDRHFRCAGPESEATFAQQKTQSRRVSAKGQIRPKSVNADNDDPVHPRQRPRRRRTELHRLRTSDQENDRGEKQ